MLKGKISFIEYLKGGYLSINDINSYPGTLPPSPLLFLILFPFTHFSISFPLYPAGHPALPPLIAPISFRLNAIQISMELYDVNFEGNAYYEVFLDFASEALERWKDLEVTHQLTVVFFCRTQYDSNKVFHCIPRKNGGGGGLK